MECLWVLLLVRLLLMPFLITMRNVGLRNALRQSTPLSTEGMLMTFLLCRDEEHHKQFLDYMNTKHANMNFTEARENNNILSFLDVQVTRCQSSKTFLINVYRKPTFSDVYTNFTSHIPLSYKTGLLWTILDRCFNICSSYLLFYEEVDKLRKIFLRNQYPLSFIENCINGFLNSKFTQRNESPMKELPFLGRLSL